MMVCMMWGKSVLLVWLAMVGYPNLIFSPDSPVILGCCLTAAAFLAITTAHYRWSFYIICVMIAHGLTRIEDFIRLQFEVQRDLPYPGVSWSGSWGKVRRRWRWKLPPVVASSRERSGDIPAIELTAGVLLGTGIRPLLLLPSTLELPGQPRTIMQSLKWEEKVICTR